MPDSLHVRRYQLRVGIAPGFTTFLQPGHAYVGQVVQSSPRRDPPLVRLFHPTDHTLWEDVPLLALDEVAEATAAG
jgi:hypothetical protein